jgi:hypothetical protein
MMHETAANKWSIGELVAALYRDPTAIVSIAVVLASVIVGSKAKRLPRCEAAEADASVDVTAAGAEVSAPATPASHLRTVFSVWFLYNLQNCIVIAMFIGYVLVPYFPRLVIGLWVLGFLFYTPTYLGHPDTTGRRSSVNTLQGSWIIEDLASYLRFHVIRDAPLSEYPPPRTFKELHVSAVVARWTAKAKGKDEGQNPGKDLGSKNIDSNHVAQARMRGPQYIFGYHPHGVIPIAAGMLPLTSCWRALFPSWAPGVIPRILTSSVSVSTVLPSF